MSSLFISPTGNYIDIVPYFILSNLPFIKKIRIPFGMILLIYLLTATTEFTINLFYNYLPHYIVILICCIFFITYLLISFFVIETDLPKLLYVFLLTLNYKAFINAVGDILLYHSHKGEFCKHQMIVYLIGLFLSVLIYLMFIKKIKLQIELWKPEICIFLMLLSLLFIFIYVSISDTDFVSLVGSVKCGFFIMLIAIIQVAVCHLIDKLLIEAKETKLLEQQLRMLNVQISEQDELFKSLEYSIKEVRKTKHDMRHHLLLIKEYVDSDDKERLLEYLNKIQCPLLKNKEPVCKNRAANAVISHYVKIAENESIKVSLNLQLPEVMDICDADLCVLFGNSLENAVEACRRMKSGPRYIRLSALYKGNFLVITIDNSFDGIIIKKDDTYYSRKRNHEEGIGISTIRSVVSKYNGVAEFKYSRNQFETSIFLNCQSRNRSEALLPIKTPIRKAYQNPAGR